MALGPVPLVTVEPDSLGKRVSRAPFVKVSGSIVMSESDPILLLQRCRIVENLE